MMDTQKVFMAMSEYEEGMARRVQHFTKVYTYSTMIAHHHTYSNIDSVDYRILVEADFLVNMYNISDDPDSEV